MPTRDFKHSKGTDSQSGRRGFTLVELIITVCVLSFGCLAVLQMQSASMRGSNLADNLTAATFLAESEMERLKSLPFTDLTLEANLGTVTTENLNRMGEVCLTPPNCPNYHFTRTINYYSNTPTSFSHQVEIEVSWRDNTGAHSVFYSGAITSYIFS
jgi:prepilin-type N-terminal cleavage/methylation domain-containing protein